MMMRELLRILYVCVCVYRGATIRPKAVGYVVAAMRYAQLVSFIEIDFIEQTTCVVCVVCG